MTGTPSTYRARCAYEVLIQAAERSAPCPSNREISRVLGSIEEAHAAVAELVREGFVEFERSPDNGRRRCFVYATAHTRAGQTGWGTAAGGQLQTRNRLPADRGGAIPAGARAIITEVSASPDPMATIERMMRDLEAGQHL